MKIWQHDWPLLTKALLWSAGWTVIAYSCLKLLTPGALPIILVFMGLVIATLLYAFYLPLFQLTSVGQQ